jgi:hypothetical protein
VATRLHIYNGLGPVHRFKILNLVGVYGLNGLGFSQVFAGISDG